jgi:hypothetical protein
MYPTLPLLTPRRISLGGQGVSAAKAGSVGRKPSGSRA